MILQPTIRSSLLLAVLLCLLPAVAADSPRGIAEEALQRMLTRAPDLGPVHAVMVSRDGVTLAAQAFDGPGLDRPANIKSLSKTVVSALVGIAVERGLIEGPEQPITELLGERVPPRADPALQSVTVDHLLSMSAGMASTSGANYGRWVTSDDWVEFALTRPFVRAPGERMQYSTGVWHLLSSILTRQSGESMLTLARRWLGEPLDVSIPPWPQDPQGVYMGGNEMLLAPRDLLAFGELYLDGGRHNGRAVVPATWIERSWTPRVRSPWSGDRYGYGWFITELGGERVYYGRGYGGQLLHVVPTLGLVVVITSRPTPPSSGGGYVRALHRLVADHVIEGARACDAARADVTCTPVPDRH